MIYIYTIYLFVIIHQYNGYELEFCRKMIISLSFLHCVKTGYFNYSFGVEDSLLLQEQNTCHARRYANGLSFVEYHEKN